MKKKLFFVLSMFLPLMANAYDAFKDGLYYNLNTDNWTAEVTSGENKQSGFITIPSIITIDGKNYTVTTIGDEAFELCQYITSVNLPSTITRIGKSAFYQCLEMQTINLPNSITEIDEGAFRYCWKLTSVDLPNSITRISDDLFSNCSALNNVTIPNGVTSIGNRAFASCLNLTTLTLPNSVVSIGEKAFYDSAISSINFPESIITVGTDAFADSKWYRNQTNGMIYIGKVAYKYKGDMAENTSLELKDGTTEISGKAFWLCTGLISINIPNSVKSIGESAFEGCSNLASVNLPNSLTEIANSTFNGCSQLASLTLPEGLLHIGNSAFGGCGFTTIALPNKIVSIGDYAFSYCNNIKSIRIPSTVTSIGNYTFAFTNISSFIIDTGNSVYDSRNNCNALIETATNTLKWGCQDSFIPEDIETIADHAFSNCNGLKSIIIPASVKSIGNYAFDSCPLLASVTLSEGLESIGVQAFYNTIIETITLPSTLTKIENYAFGGTKLTTINSLIEEPFEISSNVFYQLYSQATLYIPDGTKNLYENTKTWNQFSNIIEVTKKCEKPTIAYEKGKLKYECATENVEFITSISNSDIKSHVGKVVDLTVTYSISVVATAIGYKNSEPATATLCWIDVEPESEGLVDEVTNVKASPVIIQNNGGMLTVHGVHDGTEVEVYSLSGASEGSAISQSGQAIVTTNLQPGSFAIVKIGTKTIKLLMK